MEPEWVSARLFDVEQFFGLVVDPACGSGRIVRAARKAGYEAIGSDVVYRGPFCAVHHDFLAEGYPKSLIESVVCNPPFRFALEFVQQALLSPARKVAMLLPTKWLHGDERSRWLESTPLYRVWLLSPRPSMPPGRVIESGGKPGGGLTDFAWFVWLPGFRGDPSIGWLRREEGIRHG